MRLVSLLIRCNPPLVLCATEREIDNQEIHCSNCFCLSLLPMSLCASNDITLITRKPLMPSKHQQSTMYMSRSTMQTMVCFPLNSIVATMISSKPYVILIKKL
ncbi:hypothetical protein ACHAW6_004670 [Cyclotella cf. meneghiniana]